MSDIVERLRRQVSESPYDGFVSPLEAAAEIERLEAEIERLRGVEQDAAEWVEERTKRLRADNERLRAALEEIKMASFSLEKEGVRVWCVPIGAWDNAMRALEGKDE